MNKLNLSRRTFLKYAGMTALTVSLPGYKFTEIPGSKKGKIGIQLYTVRNEMEKNFDRAISKIAEIGYQGVETYFLPNNISIKRVAKSLQNNNLEVFSMHCELPEENQKTVLLKMAEVYKAKYAVFHGWPEDEKYKSLDALKNTVERFNNAAAFCKTNGLKFGLHNHWWEFEKFNNIIPFYYLKENLDPEIIFEIDVYWTKTAGLDPAKVVGDFGKRAPLLHIKDGPATTGKPVYQQTVLGEGSINIPSIVAAANGNTEWLVVEFDECKSDIYDAIRGSYNYLKENDLGEVKKNLFR